MKIVMVCGSSSPQNSTSLYFLKELKKTLDRDNDIEIYETAKNSVEDAAAGLLKTLPDCDAFLIAYSLYVDAIPAHLLGILKAIEESSPKHKKTLRVYQVVNNGFYEAAQNTIAIEMVWKWCQKCHFEKGIAAGIGAGSMAQAAPLGHGPCVNLGKALDRLASNLSAGTAGDTIYVEPNFPKFLYRLAGNLQWYVAARKNGLKLADLRRRQVGAKNL